MPNHSAKQMLDELVEHLQGAYAPNTLRAYRSDMFEFICYCEKQGMEALPAYPSSVAAFLLNTLGQKIKTSTIKRKVSSISAVHRLSSLPDPTKHAEVQIAMRKISRQLGTKFDQAHPITRSVLDAMLNVCGDDLRGLRNRALLLVAYDSLRRRSELVSLWVEDIEWQDNNSASILLRRSKTDQTGTGKWLHLSNEATIALHKWLSATGIERGFVFRGVLPSGRLTESLCDCQVGRIFKALAKRTGMDSRVVCSISGHSMRVGAAQDLLAQGATLPQIMIKGGWAKTDTVMRYVERVRTPVFP